MKVVMSQYMMQKCEVMEVEDWMVGLIEEDFLIKV